ncbi:MAG: alanine racemase [Actinomycetota bacterium]|nr:alanine racemase [Actinomycetota bacterium]
MDRLDRNIVGMQEWAEGARVELAPHAKTTLAPVILRKQVDAGAWGLTVANVEQASIALDVGAENVLIANEVVDPISIRRLAELRGVKRLICYVDSVRGVEILDGALGSSQRPGTRPLDVLIELGVVGGRAGVRDLTTAIEVARTAAAAASLRVVGVGGFEGVIPRRDAADAAERVADFCQQLVECADVLVDRGFVDCSESDPVILTAGGSLFFDVVATVLVSQSARCGYPTRTVIRPGCYVTHDHGMYERLSPFTQRRRGPSLEAALEVWGRVLSRPEVSRVIVDVGRRNASYDHELPRPLWWCGASGERSPCKAVVRSLADQHALVDIKEELTLAVGDWMGFGVSHPCTTFDKWRMLIGIDASGRVVEEIATCL